MIISLAGIAYLYYIRTYLSLEQTRELINFAKYNRAPYVLALLLNLNLVPWLQEKLPPLKTYILAFLGLLALNALSAWSLVNFTHQYIHRFYPPWSVFIGIIAAGLLLGWRLIKAKTKP